MKYLLLILFSLSVIFVAFVPEQGDFIYILVGFTCAFLAYIQMLRNKKFSFQFLIYLSIAIRFILIFSFPSLSDDIYRFIWDGTLIQEGISPYLEIPTSLITKTSNEKLTELFPLLNSQDYYSIYPPFSQAIFYVASLPILNTFFLSSIVIKLILLLAEIATIIFGIKLLERLNLPKENILWYALNPLIIVEIMGNVHFEGFMVCFFVLFLYFMHNTKFNLAVIFIALSIAAKLIPLLFLPYFLFKWKLKRALIFYVKIGFILILLFLPVIVQLSSFGDSLDLYFRKFEFNASIYYLMRSLGQLLYGYNTIGILGPSLGITVFLGVFYFAWRSGKNLIDFAHFALLSLSLYLFLGTTVHPWYLSLGIILSVFSNYRFMIYWSLLIVLSYSKYLWVDSVYYMMISLEYIVLFIVIVWELSRKEGPGKDHALKSK